MIGQGQTGWLASAQRRECDLGGQFVNASRGYRPPMHYCSFAIGHWSTGPLPLALCFPATSFRVSLLRRPCRDRHAGPWGREAWIHWTQRCALRRKASRACPGCMGLNGIASLPLRGLRELGLFLSRAVAGIVGPLLWPCWRLPVLSGTPRSAPITVIVGCLGRHCVETRQ